MQVGCHKETDSVHLVVYQGNPLSVQLHGLQKTLKNDSCLFPCDNLPAKRSSSSCVHNQRTTSSLKWQAYYAKWLYVYQAINNGCVQNQWTTSTIKGRATICCTVTHCTGWVWLYENLLSAIVLCLFLYLFK